MIAGGQAGWARGSGASPLTFDARFRRLRLVNDRPQRLTSARANLRVSARFAKTNDVPTISAELCQETFHASVKVFF
jgi:hypothetical protein